eukprot:m.287807 g.287807  ORF g.287807 m.287807 type:complete len:59 (-) comp19953_c0_seq7:351-527(-)
MCLPVSLLHPGYLCIDADGSILVSDTFNHCIRKITPDRAHVVTLAGRSGSEGISHEYC